MMGKLREQLWRRWRTSGSIWGIESHFCGLGEARDGREGPQDGEAVGKIKTWFGYQVHLIADTRYEIPVACRVRRASQSEVKQLEAMTEELFEETPELAKRCRDFSADRDLDSGPVKAKRWDDYGIRPLIEPQLWQREEGAGLQPHPSDHVSGPGRYHRAYRKGGSGLRLSRNRAFPGL